MKIGITGGIGSGKSIVSDYLTEHGYNVIDCDKLAREVVKPGMPALSKLVVALGPEILKDDGSLDREKAAEIVFNDDEKRKKMNDITHTAIFELMGVRLAESKSEHDFIDAPLMFETGLDKDMDAVWLVSCDDEVRKKRVAARDNMTEEQVLARMESQMPESEKRLKADEVIDNSGTMEDTYANVERLLEKYL